MRIIAVVAALLVLLPACLNAQPGTVPEDGSRLRLKVSGKSGTYLLDHVAGDTLFVSGSKDTQPSPIAFSRVEKAEMKVPRSAGWGALRGMAIGGAAGAAVGMIVGIAKWNEPDVECGAFDPLCEDTFGAMQMMGYIGVIGMSISGPLYPWSLIVLISTPVALKLLRQMLQKVPEDADAQTAKLDTAFGVLLVASLVLEGLF